MRKFPLPFVALIRLLSVGTACPTNAVRLEFTNEKEPGIWEFLEDSDCDISSNEAHEYVDCMINAYEEYSSDYTLHADECDDELAKVPGCEGLDASIHQPRFPINTTGRYTGHCEEQWSQDVTLVFELSAHYDSSPKTVASNTIDYGCQDNMGLVSRSVTCSSGSIAGALDDQGWFTGTRARDITTQRIYNGQLVGTTPFPQTEPIVGTIQVDLSAITICYETHWTLPDMIEYRRESIAVSWGGCVATPIW